MNITLRKVSELEFNKLNAPILFENNLTDRAFGVITNGVLSYKLGWQGDKQTPFVSLIDDKIGLVGIDQNLIIFNFNTGVLLLKLVLDYFFYEAKIYNGYIYIITELEIIKISLLTFEVIKRFELPDYFEGIEFNEGIIVIKCSGNDVINVTY